MSNTFNISMPEELAEQIDEQARRQGSNRSDFIRAAVRKQLDQLQRWQTLTREARQNYTGPRLTEQEVADTVRVQRDEHS
jgi:metal-responsive CopG/Arc/MetJ family transcriptional regulator